MDPTVSVVVPAAVAVVVYPSFRLTTLVLPLLSRLIKVEAVAADATPVPVGNPLITGVANVGEVPNTREPEPVSLVTADAKLALLGVARKVAIPAARPLTPVLIGNPVQLVKVPEVGVPSSGVTKVGEVAKTAAPLPVSSVRAAAKLALLGVARNVATPVPNPLTPVLTGSPVQLVSVPEVGVPRTGVTSVGLAALT